MSFPLAILAVGAFALLLERTGLPRHARSAAEGAREALRVVADPSLSDNMKETRLQKEALHLFGLFGRILLTTAFAAGLPFTGLWALDRMGLASAAGALGILGHVDFLVAAILVGALVFLLARRIRHS